MAKSAGKPAFADAGWPGDKKTVMLSDPVAAGKRHEHIAVEAACGAEVVDGFSKARLNDDKRLVLVDGTKRRPLQAAECRGCVLQSEDGAFSISL
ncbi:hypothetical protein MesoLj113a_73670 [Mesorhizobium sp. 113-1-2]|nr:hypothetical protein MesoLj113a_73670 [Mesorhizobium sp. 113-1-2]